MEEGKSLEWKKFRARLADSDVKVEQFIKAIRAYIPFLKLEISRPTEEENMLNHVDVYVNGTSFDVKGAKKNIDKVIDYSIQYLEIRNNTGRPGWLYSAVEYIVFEGETQWIISSRESLKNFTNALIDQNMDIIKSRRSTGFLDKFIQINVNDILSFSKVINKV
jgi:hypothetical protein